MCFFLVFYFSSGFVISLLLSAFYITTFLLNPKNKYICRPKTNFLLVGNIDLAISVNDLGQFFLVLEVSDTNADSFRPSHQIFYK
jgi:hypothetical protein